MAGPLSVLDEPDAAAASLPEDPLDQVAIAGIIFRSHRGIVRWIDPLRTKNRRKVSRFWDSL
jgi:hypothetical protein